MIVPPVTTEITATAAIICRTVHRMRGSRITGPPSEIRSLDHRLRFPAAPDNKCKVSTMDHRLRLDARTGADAALEGKDMEGKDMHRSASRPRMADDVDPT
jgi:hypothetical protein